MHSFLERLVRSTGLGLLLGLLGASASAETLRLRADIWMPYNGEPGAERPGYVIELARAIFEPQGITVDYQTMSWTQALGSAREGKIDGVIGAGSSELEGLIAPAEPIGEPSVVLVVLKDNPWHFESISSLKGVRLGAIDGYTYWDALDEYIKVKKEPSVIHFSGEKPLVDAIGQLRAGKIDAMPETLPVFVWTIKNMGLSLSDFWVVYKRQNEPIYLAFAKTDEGRKYSNLFDAGVRKLRASGELAAMLKSYGLTDWK